MRGALSRRLPPHSRPHTPNPSSLVPIIPHPANLEPLPPNSLRDLTKYAPCCSWFRRRFWRWMAPPACSTYTAGTTHPAGTTRFTKFEGSSRFTNFEGSSRFTDRRGGAESNESERFTESGG